MNIMQMTRLSSNYDSAQSASETQAIFYAFMTFCKLYVIIYENVETRYNIHTHYNRKN